MASFARPFNALSGMEAKKIILNEIERQLDADYRFKQHLTYPQISWAWAIHVRAWPSDNPEFKLEFADKLAKAPQDSDEKRASAASFVEQSVPFEMDFSNTRVVAAPAAGDTADSARRDAGLAVPAPRVVPGPSGTKMVVDAPAIPTAKEPEAPVEVRQSVAARVVERARETARSVTARTRANPAGVVVELPDGASAPDAARVLEIEAKEAAKPPEGAE